MTYVVRVRGGSYYNIGVKSEFVDNANDAMQFDSRAKAQDWADNLNDSIRFSDNAVFVVEALEV